MVGGLGEAGSRSSSTSASRYRSGPIGVFSWWMRLPNAVYSSRSTGVPCFCSTAVSTRTGPRVFDSHRSYHGSKPSRPWLSSHRLITWKRTSTSRTRSTSSSHREVFQAHGHFGSNHTSTTVIAGSPFPQSFKTRKLV